MRQPIYDARVTEPVSVVIPNRDGGPFLARCLAAVFAAEGVGEVIVVDDGSADGSDAAAAAEGARVLRSPARGFAAAVNQGVAESRGEALLLLNSDAFVRRDTVRLLAEALRGDSRLGLCSAALEREDGARARTFGRLLTLPSALRLALSLPPPPPAEGSGVQRVEFVPLACALVRRAAWDAVGGLDQRYRFYFEDVDLCWRLSVAGWGVAVHWDATAVHLEGGSSRARDPRAWFPQFHESRLRYLRKRYPRAWLGYAALWIPSALLHAAAWVARGDRGWARAYLRSAFAGLR